MTLAFAAHAPAWLSGIPAQAVSRRFGALGPTTKPLDFRLRGNDQAWVSDPNEIRLMIYPTVRQPAYAADPVASRTPRENSHV